MEGMIIVKDFDLALTLASGQFFRYYQQEKEYLLLTQMVALKLSQKGNKLTYQGANEEFVRTLFGLDELYNEKISRLKKDPLLREIVQSYNGLRIMRQDLHEAIIGFICSSQSNIQKIRMNLHLLAQSSNNSIQDHAFLPRPGVALSEEIVRNAKTGYRSKFICATNVLLTKEFLEKVANASYEESHDILCSLPGIGPKIADCICLFSLGHGEAFPVDVHIARAMRAKFPHAKLNDEKSIKCFAQKRWGNDAGLAQQFLFQWARDMRKDLIA